MTTATLIAAAAVLVGATVQSGLGFGFAIVAAPVLAATDGPASAAPTVALASVATSTLVLVAERRPREILVPAALRLTGWAVPGLVAGALLLAHLPARPLSVLVALAVLAAIVLQARGDRRVESAGAVGTGSTGAVGQGGRGTGVGGTDADGTGALAGFTSGVLQGSVGLNGPPLVLHLLARGATPAQLRDTLAAVFAASSALALVVLAVGGVLRPANAPLLLLAAAIAGWALGRVAFWRLQRVHAPLSRAVLAFGAVAALAQAALA